MSAFAMGGEISKAFARHERIAKAALEVFLRFGYGHTKMADIAEAAGISRPTLYLSFADKEAVFRAVVDMIVKAKVATIREGLAVLHDVEARLEFACEVWGVDGVELVLMNPNAKDVFDSSFEPVREGYAVFEQLLVDILSRSLSQEGFGVSPHELARSIVYAIKGFKDTARDGEDMRRMVRALTATVSAALGSSKAIGRIPTKTEAADSESYFQ